MILPNHVVFGFLFYPKIFSLHFNGHFSRLSWVSWYQNVSILDFVGAKDDGDDVDRNKHVQSCSQIVITNKP